MRTLRTQLRRPWPVVALVTIFFCSNDKTYYRFGLNLGTTPLIFCKLVAAISIYFKWYIHVYCIIEMFFFHTRSYTDVKFSKNHVFKIWNEGTA